MEQLVIIKSVMEPKDYSTLRALLKNQQGERITPYIFKLADTQPVENYLSQQKIDYEVYNRKEQDKPTDQELEEAYQEAYSNPQRIMEFKQWEKLALTS
jgi:hypothetical protein